MKIHKLHYFNIYKLHIKILLLLILCCFFLCCEKKQGKQVLSIENHVTNVNFAVNINTASVEELQKLPNIGEKTALAIIEHRERFGKFRKPEHLMLVPRISDRRFREIRHFIKTE